MVAIEFETKVGGLKMDTTKEMLSVEMVDAMIRVNNGVMFLDTYAPIDWKQRFHNKISTYGLYLTESHHDVLAYCFRDTVLKKSFAYGWRAHSVGECDYRKHKILHTSVDVRKELGTYMWTKSRTRINWIHLGFEQRSFFDKKERVALTSAWRQQVGA